MALITRHVVKLGDREQEMLTQVFDDRDYHAIAQQVIGLVVFFGQFVVVGQAHQTSRFA